MDLNLRNRWLDALRSGKYKQGRHFLRNNADEFCCLGVLCDIYDPNKWKKREGDNAYIYDDNSISSLPSYLRKELGKAFQRDLIYFNDTDSLSFLEIADWIEEFIV